MFKSTIYLFLIAVISACFIRPAIAETAGVDFQKNMQNQYDWVLSCELDTLPNYLKYKDSLMNPIDRFKISYQFSETRAKLHHLENVDCRLQQYEELWYHGGKAAGLWRVGNLPTPKDMQGAIYFRSSMEQGIANHTSATANCAVRLLLDILAKRSSLVAIAVPAQCFEQVSSDLSQFGFFPINSTFDTRSENMSLLLLSYPKGAERYFVFDAYNLH